MKSIKKFLVVLLAVLVLVGCSSKPASKDDASIVTEIKEDVTVTFWHAMNGAQEESLTRITKAFMDANPKIKIELLNQSKYPDLQSKINAAMQSPKDLPTITQAYPNWLWTAATVANLLVDIDPYLNHTDLGLKDIDDINKALLDGAKIDGKQYGMPFNKSTEVLYYNKDLLAQYGVEVPTTMEELKEASKTIYEKSNGEVVGVGFDSLTNYYSIGMKEAGVEFNKDLDITSDASVNLIKYYQDGIKEGYFRIAGSDKYLSGPFGEQRIAMNIGSMAGESHVKKGSEGKFEYGVALRPSKVNLQQGTDIYMFSEATPEQRTAAFLYMKHLVSKESQLDWSVSTGYMPVRTSVQSDKAYTESESKVAPLIADATKNLFPLPVIENSDPAYQLSGKIVEDLLVNKDKDVKETLEGYKAEMKDTWNQ